MERISSTHNPRFKNALKLHTSRGRKSQNRFIIFGEREILLAVSSQVEIVELFVTDQFSSGSWTGELAGFENVTSILSPELFKKLQYGDRDFGVIAIAETPEVHLADITIPPSALILVAEAIEKPGNLGAILRSADACGADGVILADKLTDFFHPNTIRTSTGAIFFQTLASAATEEVQEWLSDNQFKVVSAIVDGAENFYDVDLSGKTAIVVGNEANGLSEAWRNPEYTRAKLPMMGQVDSLNVSVTSAVMLYEAHRQRRG